MKKKYSSGRRLTSIIVASSAGTLIEWYDFFIFGSLATIISTEFFPRENPTASFLATLATFSAGLIVRPLGALFFGRLGDLIGRKYTFMVTLIMMGVCTIGIGLVPGYESIGFLAPLIILVLRLLQGLALGGEYGGAATYVAEHSPENRRGFLTSWIQSTSGIAFVLSMIVILLIKASMPEARWLKWGWRIPFLASVVLIAVSVYIRSRMAESPLFEKAKSEGKTSKKPLRESFRKKENLKLVLLAFFGLTFGGGAIGWITFYAQSFLLKTLMLDFDQANTIIIIGILLGVPFFFFFGWLSDKIGRKVLLISGMLLGAVLFRPIFGGMYKIAGSESQYGKIAKIIVDESFDYTPDADTVRVVTTRTVFESGAVRKEVKKQASVGRNLNNESSYALLVSSRSKWKLVFLVFSLQFIFTMAYGPLGAYMVEMFPLKIRYTSISLPYHFGFGIFGGLAPYFATYLVAKADQAGRVDYYLAGLSYPVLLTCISVVAGAVYLKEYNRYSFRLVPVGILNFFRRWLGIVWLILAVSASWFGIYKIGIPDILSGHTEDVVFGIILTFIITPAFSLGLLVFGWYALKGEYQDNR